jgi:hypothetical protein
MVNEFYLTVNGKPVGMYIQRTHEDRDHQSLIVEIFSFFNLLNHNNLTIGRSNDQFVGIAIEIADRTAVEVESHEPGGTKDDYKDPEEYIYVEAIPNESANAYNG